MNSNHWRSTIELHVFLADLATILNGYRLFLEMIARNSPYIEYSKGLIRKQGKIVKVGKEKRTGRETETTNEENRIEGSGIGIRTPHGAGNNRLDSRNTLWFKKSLISSTS